MKTSTTTSFMQHLKLLDGNDMLNIFDVSFVANFIHCILCILELS